MDANILESFLKSQESLLRAKLNYYKEKLNLEIMLQNQEEQEKTLEKIKELDKELLPFIIINFEEEILVDILCLMGEKDSVDDIKLKKFISKFKILNLYFKEHSQNFEDEKFDINIVSSDMGTFESDKNKAKKKILRKYRGIFLQHKETIIKENILSNSDFINKNNIYEFVKVISLNNTKID
ncbi:MAG: hypothetical protein NC181_04850 [Clostridium sp.]|nr:hypothetical protein [Clostridium sp.]MCM1444575.1 hypothetical protein [Candidatus Amulumruptor caecigallinarius]